MVQNRFLLVMSMYPSASLFDQFPDRLSVVVSVRPEPHNGYVNERVLSFSGIVPRQSSRGMENLVTSMTDSNK